MTPVASGYRRILDELLEEPAPAGQGGRWEANPDQIFALVRLEALLSSFLAREIKQMYGAQARELVRTAAAGYGRYRGTEIRRRVEKLGLPLDLPHMWEWWDLAVTSSREEERMNDDLEPYYHGFEVGNCPFNDIYQLHYPPDLMALAAIFYEEALPAQARAYNPQITMTLPRLMERGDPTTEYDYVLAG